jgi:hypothetical protein
MQNPFDDDMNIIPEPPSLDGNNSTYKFPSAEGFETVPADWKPTPDKPVPALRCTHEREDGSRCKKFGLRGTGFNGTPAMCFVHGGSLPAVKAKAEATVLSARMRLIQSIPMALDTLLDLAENANAEAIKLKAAESILDRTGLKQALEIQVEVTNAASPSEDILKKLAIMRERAAPKLEDLGEKDENEVEEPES